MRLTFVPVMAKKPYPIGLRGKIHVSQVPHATTFANRKYGDVGHP